MTIAQKRNALPVPADQYGGTPGSTYNYWDQLDLNALKPTGAASAEIALLYQGTSWEYIQFLDNANDGQNAFLGLEGRNMLQAWINAEVPVAMTVAGDKKMVPPVVMASAAWGAPPTGNTRPVAVDNSYSTAQNTLLSVAAPGMLGNDSDPDGDPITAVLVSNVSHGTLGLSPNGGFSYTPSTNYTGQDSFTYQARDSIGALSNIATVLITVTATGGGATAGVATLQTGVLSGKGQNQTFTPQTSFTAGSTVTLRATVRDGNGASLPNATVTLAITGPETVTLTSGPSNAQGIADASWKTSAPKGNKPGTTPGSYTATTANVTATGYSWDGVATASSFAVQ